MNEAIFALEDKVTVEDGERTYFAMKGDVQGFKDATERESGDQIQRHELYGQSLDLMKERGVDIGTGRESVSFEKGRLDKMKKGLSDEKDVRFAMENLTKKMAEGRGHRPGMGAILEGGDVLYKSKVTKADNLPFALQSEYKELFEKRKKDGQLKVFAGEKTHPLFAEGIGLAALKSGDLKTASEALAFSMATGKSSPELMSRVDQALQQQDPTTRQRFEEQIEEAEKFQQKYE